ncbi:MAG: redox-sensing transcriptional repressor Rex [Clostridia bacterium]|nr:redox-sensing transcriptional repressor Rex [Clostridia bacterium]
MSQAVIKRLPRYFRYLRMLIRMGKTRVSSAELSRMMNVTASQVRQDLNCFGGFGQQGYGYNVQYLYSNICEILGVEKGLRAAVVGVGNLGSALIRSPMFEKRGVNVVALFDISPDLIGRTVAKAKVYPMEQLERRLDECMVDMVVLTLPKEEAEQVAARIATTQVRGIWNFTGQELDLGSRIVVENEHIGDSLMTLCYELAKEPEEQ